MKFKGKRVRAVEYGHYVTVRIPESTGVSDDHRVVRIGVESHGSDKEFAALRLYEARDFANAILSLLDAAQDGPEGER